MGPPYPLAADKHSSAEKKANWQNSLDNGPSQFKSRKKVVSNSNSTLKKRNKVDSSSKFGNGGAFDSNNKAIPLGGGGGIDKELTEEQKKILQDLYAALAEHGKLISANEIDMISSQDFGLTLAEQIGIDADKIPKEELETMRKAALKHYSKNQSEYDKHELIYKKNEEELEKEKRAKELAEKSKNDKTSKKGSGGSGKSGSKKSSSGNSKSNESEEDDYEKWIEDELKNAKSWEDILYEDLDTNLKDKSPTKELSIIEYLNDRGTNKDGSKYDNFKVALGEAGIDTDQFSDYEIDSMRKKVLDRYQKIVDAKKDQIWETVLYDDFFKGKDPKTVLAYINEKGTNSDGSKYDNFIVSLGEAGLDFIDEPQAKIEQMRKKASEHYKKMIEQDNKKISHSLQKPFVNELYHHGVLGQKWGKRNGPPYPLSRGKETKENKKKKISKSGVKEYAKKLNTKSIKTKTENISPATATLREAGNITRSAYNIADITKKKKRHIDSSRMSDAELREAINRLNMEKQYSDLMNERSNINNGREKLLDILEVSGEVLAIGTSAAIITSMIYGMKNK